MGVFGYQVAGSSWTTSGDIIRGSIFTCPSNGRAVSITAYVKKAGSSPLLGFTVTFKYAIYRHSDGVLIGYTNEGSTTNTSGVWVTLNIISGGILVAGEVYVLVLFGKYEESLPRWKYPSFAYDVGDPNQGHFKSLVYNGFPDPIAWEGHNDRKHSIYCTYSLPAKAGLHPSKPLSVICSD